jgi:glucose/arabinose dehydrogenase
VVSPRGIAPLLLTAALALAACGEDEETTTGPATEAEAPARDAGDGEPPPVGDGEGGVRLDEIGTFEAPVFVAQPPGERRDMYVVEQGGRVMLVDDGEVAPEPFLDLSDETIAAGEQGLLSIAFAPDYRSSGRFYVDFTDLEGDTRVQEFRRSDSDPRVADPATRRELLHVDQPYSNHNGGLLLFGPDRKLYIGLGDGGAAEDPDRNGQDLGTLLGKILRIDPLPSGGRPYGIPRSNPFVDQGGARPEIYAYGLRNPWRFSFDRVGGALSIGDVGQNEFEEVDLVARDSAAGANFGWSAFEGDERFNSDQEAPGHVSPVLTYPLDGDNCAVTGGYVVRDESLRSLYGRYLYGDFCAGELRSFTARPGEPANDDRALGVDIPQLSSFAEDGRGRIFATSLGGPVYRLAAAD